MKLTRVAVVLLLCGCPDKKPAGYIRTLPDGGIVTRNPVKLPEPKRSDAEVEFSGTLEAGDVKAARYVFVFSKTPCEGELDVIQKEDIHAGKFAGELFFPQGTQAHLCAAALDDKGQLIGVATYAKNPVLLQGEGEVEFTEMQLKLNAVSARPAPKGL